MRKTKKILLQATLVSLLALFASCDKIDDNPIFPDDNSGTVGNKSGHPIPSLTWLAKPNGIVTTISFDQLVSGFKINYVMGYAHFGTSNSLDAGTVSVNGNSLTKYSSGSIYYSSFNPTAPATLTGVNFNGTAHSWNVAGKNSIPQFELAVSSPLEFELTSPSSGATVSKTSDLDITWTITGGSADSIMIFLSPTTGSVTPYSSNILPNNGFSRILSAELSRFSGSAILQVVKFKYAYTTQNDQLFLGMAEIVKSNAVTIN